jgi:hypothetical protein
MVASEQRVEELGKLDQRLHASKEEMLGTAAWLKKAVHDGHVPLALSLVGDLRAALVKPHVAVPQRGSGLDPLLVWSDADIKTALGKICRKTRAVVKTTRLVLEDQDFNPIARLALPASPASSALSSPSVPRASHTGAGSGSGLGSGDHAAQDSGGECDAELPKKNTLRRKRRTVAFSE